MRPPIRATLLACALALSTSLYTFGNAQPKPWALASLQSTRSEVSSEHNGWRGPGNVGVFVRKFSNGRTICLEANSQQAERIANRTSLPMTALNPDSDPAHLQRTGLRIQLRGTDQLSGYPLAVNAFERAAAQWESLIRSNITVVVDVDFGPTVFGAAAENDVVSTAYAQVIGGNCLYPSVRQTLLSSAIATSKQTLYGALPSKVVPTDNGSTQGVAGTSANLRALNLIDGNADPSSEASDFGPPPAIALNSRFPFDFDASDGIDTDKLDFESIALHEIGHVLGFISFAGQREVDSSIELEPSLFDLFRIRPESVATFAVADRVLSSGGQQAFYAGDTALALSTARPDGTGGDANEPSHWKDNSLTGHLLGIMDPTLAPGERQLISDNDLSALDAIGYQVRSIFDPTTVVSLTAGSAQPGGMPAPPPNLGVLSHTQYSIAVPPGATQLSIELNGDQDVDLFVRFGQPVVLQGHDPRTDYMSTTDSNFESITIDPESSPPLRPGIYFIAVANFGPGDATYTVTARVTGGSDRHFPVIFDGRSKLEGDTLSLKLAVSDTDSDASKLTVRLLDAQGQNVDGERTIDLNPAPRLEPEVTIAGLSNLPSALQASITVTDRSGLSSQEVLIDFSRGDAGALNLTSGSFDGSKLTLKTRENAEGLQIEINGVVVAPPRSVKIKQSGKITVKGSAAVLGFRSGTNRIRVKNVNGWSNILLLNT